MNTRPREGAGEVATGMGNRPARAIRKQRERVLAPLFKQMKVQRMSSVYVADRLRIPAKRFWAYMHGETRIPEEFIARVCRIIALDPDTITIPEPRDRFIQQPRAKKSAKSANGGKAKRAAKPSTGGSDHAPSRGRRSPRTSPLVQGSQTGADDLPPGRASRRVARQAYGLTAAPDLEVMSGSLASDL